jgi:hypothetical protein
MANYNTKWYVDQHNYDNHVTVWATGQVKTVGNLIRATAPSVGNERVFVCVVAGTTHASTQPTWVVTKGAETTDNDIKWRECAGHPAMNGDAANTPSWTTVKNNAVVVGCIIKDVAGTHYFMVTTAGTCGNGSEPSWDFSDLGDTTDDNGVTWLYIGLVSTFAATPWGAPHARLANALATNWGAAGDTFYVGHEHAETKAAASQLTFPGTAANWNTVLCVDDAVAPPTTLATTGSIATTGAFTITMRAFAYVYGITFTAASSSSTGHVYVGDTTYACGFVLDNCLLKLNTTSTTARIRLGTAASATARDTYVELVNTNLQFGADQSVLLGGVVVWNGGTFVAAGAISWLFLFVNYVPALLFVTGCDLSAVTSGSNIIVGNVLNYGKAYFSNCKVAAGVLLAVSNSASLAGPVMYFDNCDSADPSTACRMEYCMPSGNIVNETVIVKANGATNGVVPISHKIKSTGSSAYYPTFVTPLRGPTMTVWNDTLSSITVAVDILHDSLTNLKDDEVWLEVEYLGNAGFPFSAFLSDRKTDIMATAADQATTYPATWTTTGITNPNYQRLLVTVVPAERGEIRATVCLAKASYTVYVDPTILINGYPVSTKMYIVPGSAYVNQAKARLQYNIPGVGYLNDMTRKVSSLPLGFNVP